MNQEMKVKIANELVKLAKELIGVERDLSGPITLKVKSAYWSDHEPKVVVAVTKDNKVVYFLRKHYDGKGNVHGPYGVFPKSREFDYKDVFYHAGNKLSQAHIDQLGYSPDFQKKLIKITKDFARKNR